VVRQGTADSIGVTDDVPYMRREGIQLVSGFLYSLRCQNGGSRAGRATSFTTRRRDTPKRFPSASVYGDEEPRGGGSTLILVVRARPNLQGNIGKGVLLMMIYPICIVISWFGIFALIRAAPTTGPDSIAKLLIAVVAFSAAPAL
jgi:hypothetical protein